MQGDSRRCDKKHGMIVGVKRKKGGYHGTG